MRIRNLLVRPPFVMYYLTFLLPRARKLLVERGFGPSALTVLESRHLKFHEGEALTHEGNPVYDDLYRQALAAAATDERLRLYGELQAIIREECPWIFMSFARAYSLHHRHVAGYRPHDFPYGMEKYLRHR